MKHLFIRGFIITSCFVLMLCGNSISPLRAQHSFNEEYRGRNLDRVAFPIGGIGAGMYCLEGTCAISHLSVFHRMDIYNEPVAFAAICLKGEKQEQNTVRVLEGALPDYKYFGRPSSGLGAPGKMYGLPRFEQCAFRSRFPFCEINLSDKNLPLKVDVIGFSPFIPGDADASSWPAGTIDYQLKNISDRPLELVFSFHSRNFMGEKAIESFPNGFRLVGPEGEFAFAVMNEKNVAVDHCWYRGGWWDSTTLMWSNVQSGNLVNSPPDNREKAPGASLYVPVTLVSNETKTVRLLTCWYVPRSELKAGNKAAVSSEKGVPLSKQPAPGTSPKQQKVSGYLGQGLVNTFYPEGDSHIGILRSKPFVVAHDRLYFLVGGGRGPGVGVALCNEKGKQLLVARGHEHEQLEWVNWSLTPFKGQQVYLEVFDKETDSWGHINVDHFVLSSRNSDLFLSKLHDETKVPELLPNEILLADFENTTLDWELIPWQAPPKPEIDPSIPATYTPWYSVRYKSLAEVAESFQSQYDELRAGSEAFAQVMRQSTLPPEINEAVEANLTILKSPTVLRQQDGRLWGWEGNSDNAGCCHGTCTHVWNYAQSICHLFPALEQSIRQTEFFDALLDTGRQAFRCNLPITPGGTSWDAADGQLGCIMKVHRDWKISGNNQWLQEFWPHVVCSLECSITTWDPLETGLLELSHHNTYDINYLGPDGHCGSFYLGALAAAIKMGKALGEDVSRYEAILKKGATRMENELFNGEYFVQMVPVPGKEGNPERQSEYYQQIARQIDEQGPKYQYGTGCLSDGVLGFWMAKVCGIDDDLIDPAKIHSHLLAVYEYNFRQSLAAHSNTQRPGYAMGDEGGLLLCSWPHGEKPLLPFVYSDEVWTGIEYQVASHLMFFGENEKGLDIVRACRKRYDGIRRNPFNEFECGHWYARAMSSFALFQGMTGLRYDAGTQTLYARKTKDSWTTPLFTATGFGIVRYNATTGSVDVDVVRGKIPLQTTSIIP